MRSRIVPLALLLAAGLAVVPQFAHAMIPFFGPIIPDSFNQCAIGWGGVIIVINNIIELAITLVLVAFAPLSIAYAGFKMVVNPNDSGARTEARNSILNIIIGIVVTLMAWLIVDAVMAAFVVNNGQPFGTRWQDLISSGGLPPCLNIPTLLKQTPSGMPIQGVTAGGTGVVGSNGVQQCSPSNSACSPSTLQNAGLNPQQANVMSCIAMTESSGNPSQPPYNQSHPGSNSTACGTFQITQTTWNSTASGACSDFAANCQNAACNAQVAAKLVSQSNYSSWTCANCNAKAASCIQAYSGS